MHRFRPASFLASALLCLCSALNAKPFTLPVLPDTQIEVRARPEMLHSQLDWLVKNRQELQIPMVLHVGDIVDWDNTTHRIIRAKIPVAAIFACWKSTPKKARLPRACIRRFTTLPRPMIRIFSSKT